VINKSNWATASVLAAKPTMRARWLCICSPSHYHGPTRPCSVRDGNDYRWLMLQLTDSWGVQLGLPPFAALPASKRRCSLSSFFARSTRSSNLTTHAPCLHASLRGGAGEEPLSLSLHQYISTSFPSLHEGALFSPCPRCAARRSVRGKSNPL
jgi:hypothetical protein